MRFRRVGLERGNAHLQCGEALDISGALRTHVVLLRGQPAVPRWITGGGSVFTGSGVRVTHGFELYCIPDEGPNNLQVNWGKNKFHLTSLTSAACTDDPAIAPDPPTPTFDTYTGTGTGTYNGQAGATASWTFTDAGEPGTNDTATLTIKNAANAVVLSVSGKLNNGNHQAHDG